MAGTTTQRAVRLHRNLSLVAFVLICAIATRYVLQPDAVSELLVLGAVAVPVVSWFFGPVLRGARPLWFWGVVGLTSVSFLTALALRPDKLIASTLGPADFFYLLGYLLFGTWYVLMARRTNALAPRSLILNTGIATTTVVLALWVFAGHPDENRHLLPTLQFMLYPILDAMSLAVAAHVGLRIGRSVPAWWWNVCGVAAQLCLDLVYAVYLPAYDSLAGRIINIIQLLPFFCVAVGATSPHVVLLNDIRVPDRTTSGRERGTTVVALLVLPAFATLALPSRGPSDWPLRFALVGILLLLLFTQLVLTLQDLKASHRATLHRATHDPLTGLFNRSAIFDELGALLRRHASSERRIALFFLDCDHFKDVNDTWGHHAGDALLRGVAEVLPRAAGHAGHTGHAGLVGRLGGDEFVVAVPVETPDDAHEIAWDLLEAFRTPIQILPDRAHVMTPSIGVALSEPGDLVDPLRLLGRADAALYEAKSLGRARHVLWTDELSDRIQRTWLVQQSLRDAVAGDRVTIDLQPIRTGPGYADTLGWECLARWNDPVLGPVPPDVFIPVAEELDLIRDLGASVLRQACAALVELRRSEPQAQIFVNVSPRQLIAPDFVDTVVDTLAAHGLETQALWLEITENIPLADERTSAVVDALRALGIRMCLDDFGTGYASLGSVVSLSLDCVKLDRSLLERQTADDGSPEVLRHLLGILSAMDVQHIIAEGVETAEQAAALESIGCELVQGWYFGRPAPLQEWLAPDSDRLATPA